MKNTIKSVIESFVYPHLEYFTDMVYKDREDTIFKGIRVLDDKEKFTQGALVNGASLLYTYYVKTKDDRQAEVLDRLHLFIELAASTTCKTWGKLGILRGYNALYENGLADKIEPDYLDLIKDKTNYEDFFDKATIDVPGMATNYMHVAMACAGYREKFGWENDSYAEKVKNKLNSIISSSNEMGWMDDEIPYGRYDRYSLVLSSEFFDTAADINLTVPDEILANLKDAAKISLFLANKQGDGILYGRSVPAHGDATGAEVLASALAAGLVEPENIPLALAYIMQVVKKLIDVWYDSDARSFNMWWGGRSTNHYRGMGRVLEVNLDLANHLCTILKNLERAGLADTEVSEESIPAPKEWDVMSVTFSEQEDSVKKCIFMRRDNLLVSLPFTGLGRNWGLRSAYYPFPVISRIIEASPTAELPFFVPEYTDKNGEKFRPCQHFTSVDTERDGDCIRVKAKGYLSSAETRTPERSEYPFSAIYNVSGGKISVVFSTYEEFDSAKMVVGKVNDLASITTLGFDTDEQIDTKDDANFDGVHSRIYDARICTASQTKALGYEINFEEYFK